MNTIYRSIWNDKTGTFVAAPENASSAGKKSSSCVRSSGAGAHFALKTLAVSLALSFSAGVWALPAGGVVTAGGASIQAAPGNTVITQTTQNAAINWQSFGIARGESVQFVQPNSSSVALNRVMGSDPSNIFGSLSANGRVFLVNPNGVLFGQGASVNVGGLVASTLNVTDTDFMAGNYRFAGAGTGTVLNQGTINAAEGGYVTLLGRSVANDGVLSATLGTVALAAGTAMTLDMAGDRLINVSVDQGAVNALVRNGGLIQADGGQVLLTAQAAGSLLATAVNNTGVIQAQSLQAHDGVIKLLGDMQSGTMHVGGTLDASAPNGGNGGFIETSAAHVKVASGATITTAATTGKTGNWLIDPNDFTISPTGDITATQLGINLVANNVTISTLPGVNSATNLYATALGNGDIHVNGAVTWTASGAATTLTLNAERDVNVNAAVTANTGSLVANAGRDVNFNAAVTANTGNIVANAVGDVTVQSGVTGITANSGNITWTAGRDIQVNTGIATGITATGGNINWIGGRDININSPVTTTDGNFSACCGRDININAPMTTTGGSVLLRAGADGSGPAGLLGGTVNFGAGILYTVTAGLIPGSITVDYTPTSYATPTNYSGNFTGTGAGALTQHMLVFVKGNDKVYDGNTTATLSFKGTPTLGGVVTLDAAVGATATFDDKNVANNIGITYAGYSLGGADAGKFVLWESCIPGPLRASGNITPSPLAIKAFNDTKAYNGLAYSGGNGVSYTSFVGGETPAVLGGTLVYSGTSQGAVKAGTYAITPGGLTSTNYAITYSDGVLTVSKVPLLIKAIDDVKTYNGLAYSGGNGATYTSFVNGETSAVLGGALTYSGNSQGAVNAGSYIITPGGQTSTNYTISYADGALLVNKAPLLIKAIDDVKTYNGLAYSGGNGVTYASFVNGETPAVLGGALTYAGNSQGAVNAGSYVITPGGRTSTNYTISYADGALLVNKAPMTIKASDATKVYGETPVLSAFTLPVPPVNGETVVSVVETSPGTAANATVAGSTYPITITPGSATGTYLPANYIISYLPGNLTVTPKPLVGSITAADKVYDANTTATILTRTLAGVINGDTVSYTGGTANFDTPNPGINKPVLGTGLGLTGADAGNYTVNPTAPTIADITQLVVPPPFVPPYVVPPVTPISWIPVVTPPTTPPQLVALMPPPPPAPVVPQAVAPMPAPTPAPVVSRAVQPPVVAPVQPPAPVYVPPVRPRKQDRN